MKTYLHSTLWKEATWRFASEENLKAFNAEPEKYAPQYGGYCAWAMSRGEKANVDPEQWTIVNGKLYLNYNAKIKNQWLEDKLNFIRLADEKWSEIEKN